MTKILNKLAVLSAFVLCAATTTADTGAGYAEGTWTIAARGGVAPTNFNKKVDFRATFAEAGDIDPKDDETAITRDFNKIYSLPFTMGVDLGYFVADNVEVFLGFDYAHACSKKVTFNAKDPVPPISYTWKVGQINSYGGYLGGRYFFSPVDTLLPFVGAKVGIKSIGSCKRNETMTRNGFTLQGVTVADIVHDRGNAKNCASFSGALQLGFDWMFTDVCALTFMSEFMHTSSKLFKAGTVVHTDVPGSFVSSEVRRNPRSTWSFPLTLGVRFRM